MTDLDTAIRDLTELEARQVIVRCMSVAETFNARPSQARLAHLFHMLAVTVAADLDDRTVLLRGVLDDEEIGTIVPDTPPLDAA
jgi:hypothetical protein